ncbi:MAG: DUF2029 domain-containing protein [Hyphomicrobiaceae bacterium]
MAGCSIVLILFGDRFAWDRRLVDIPALQLAGGLAAAGAVYALLFPLIQLTERDGPTKSYGLLGLVLLAGFGLRLMMIPSMPALEDDFYRYLWDGGVTAAGYNPYALSPASVRTDEAPPALRRLAEHGSLILDRVNHPELKTIYPPVAQASFAVAHWIEPWSLRAWRLVCLVGEFMSLLFLLLLLGAVGHSPLWVALYWLNPLVIKELLNSAHMEAIVLPFVLAALYFLVRSRPLAATAALGLAIGAKLWPVMLLPLVLSPLIAAPRRLVAALALLGLMAIAWFVPPWIGGLGADSGFVAYATYWQTNSALFQSLQSIAGYLLSGFDVAETTPGMLVRAGAAIGVAVFAIWLAREQTTEPKAIVARAAMVVLALFIVSPAQFPWYASWILIFAPLLPLAMHVGVTVLLPLYYVSFYLAGIDRYVALNSWLIWLQWLPIWSLLLFDARLAWHRPLAADLTMRHSRRS